MLGTRRIGPDLSREGNRRSDEWLFAHVWNPRSTEPQSVMPAFTWLYRVDPEHDRKVLAFLAKFDKNRDGRVTRSELDRSGDGVVAPEELPADWKDLDIWPVNPDGSAGDGVIDMHDYGAVPTREALAVASYLQTLGTSIGDWRVWEPWPTDSRPVPTEPAALRESRGKKIFENKCSGCHGLYANGRLTADDGVSGNFNDVYHFLSPQPRNFTLGTFKSRTTQSGELPRDEDIYRTISRGVRRGQIMPSWANPANGHALPERDRWDLVDYVKTFSERFKTEKAPPPIDIPTPPYASARDAPPDVIREGRLVFRVLQCWSCHGIGGKGDGPSASTLLDDWEVPIRPFDFTKGNFKFGDSPADVYRTFNTGLAGVPMPTFYDTILYTKEAFPDLRPWQQRDRGAAMFTDADVREIGDYIATLPGAPEIEKLGEHGKKVFADRRRWALVYYALSLAHESRPSALTSAGFAVR
jgi:cytochrome c oxidase cbb3-type subunit 2